MATFKVIENILDGEEKIFEVDAGKTVEEIIRNNTSGDEYTSTLVECYDCETGETTYVPITDDSENLNVTILVNQKDASLDYVIKSGDIVSVIFIPTNEEVRHTLNPANWSYSALRNALLGAASGAITGFLVGNMPGAIIGCIVGFFGAGILTTMKEDSDTAAKNGKHSKGIDSENLPDVRGSANQPLTGNVFPFVLGKHLVTPFIIGSPYNEFYGEYGDEMYVHALFLVGYAPLRLYDLKLGDQMLAYNRSWSGNKSLENIFHGLLKGVNSTDDGRDLGDIVSTWGNNDISVEILQQGQNGEAIDWGSVYPYAKIQDDIEANVLYIVDGASDTVSYKGVSLKNGLRNNPVKFTRQCPLSARIELDFQSGLTKSWSESDDNGNSSVKYGTFPLWVAMQWRVYSKDNEVSNGDKNGVIAGEMTPGNENYWWNSSSGKPATTKRGWNSFSVVNGGGKKVSFTPNVNSSYGYYLTYSGSGATRKITGFEISALTNDSYSISIGSAATEDTPVSFTIIDKYTVSWSAPSAASKSSNARSITYTGTIRAGETSTVVTDGNGLTCTLTSNAFSGDSIGDNSCKFERYITNFKIGNVTKFETYQIINTTFSCEDVYNHSSSDIKELTNSNVLYFPNTTDKYYSEVISDSLVASVYTASARATDREAHTGNTYTATDINDDWLNATAFNLEPLCGTWEHQKGVSQFRVVSEVNFEEWARANFTYSSEEEFIEQFNAYFLSSANTTKSIEVRVVRLSPNYIDQITSTSKKSADSYSDIFSWKTLTSTMFDESKLINDKEIVQKHPLSDIDMRKFCVVAIKAKTDNTDQIGSTVKKFTCNAESFAPYYDSELKQWFPKEVNSVEKYYKPYDSENNRFGAEITREQFIADRQSTPKIKSIMRKAGNDFTTNIINNVIRTDSNKDELGRYYIPVGYTLDDNNDRVWDDAYITDENDNKLWNKNAIRYCENNVASCILLAGIGRHVGVNALSYADYDMVSLSKVFEFCKSVKDGSTYNSDGVHYNHFGEEVEHSKGEEVDMYFTANAYVYESQKLEDMLSALSVAARGIYTRNSANKLTFITDKPEKYPVALINQSNVLASSYSISYADLPSGLLIPFKDENDGYIQNNIYVMRDGETQEEHTSPIEQYALSFITNPYHIWSIGRYLLANRILNRETVSKKIGMEGFSVGLGNLVKIQDDTMLIGSDTGGRITQLIEDSDFIYGFLINNTYKYTGELDDNDRVKKGVVVMQPAQFGSSRVITLRMAPVGTVCEIPVNGDTFTVKKGDTNVVIFENKLSKNGIVIDSENSVYYVYNPKVDNIVGFGEIGNETALYRVVGIKSDEKHNYDLTLLKYQEDLYKYGEELPTFQNNVTTVDYDEPQLSLSESVSFSDLAQILTTTSRLAKGQIDSTFGTIPPVPTSLTADIKRDCIQLECAVVTSDVNNVDHIVYEITKYRLNGNEVESRVSTISGSYSTEYYLDRTWEGYPEKKGNGVVANDGSLDFWTVRAKAVSIYLDENGDRLESAWSESVNLSASSLSEYGTWIPPVPTSILPVAGENGITTSWTCDTSNVYGSIQYKLSIAYNGTISEATRPSQTTILKKLEYTFDRSIDGFPEKEDSNGDLTAGAKLGTKSINKFGIKITAINAESGAETASEVVNVDVSEYKTWIPSTPSVSSRVSNRNVTLYMGQTADCYGSVQYLVGVRRYDDIDDFYVPDLDTNPYSRESAYKLLVNGIFKLGHIESESQFMQTMPLETQSGEQSLLDYNDDTSDDKSIVIPVSSGDKTLVLSLGSYNPVDTSYQFEVYAYNKTVEDYYDSLSNVDHDYDVSTYHAVSESSTKKTAIALATSVQDVLRGSIVSDKIADGAVQENKLANEAVTETKIADDAVSTPKLMANAVVADKVSSNAIETRHLVTNAVTADKIYTYNMVALNTGVHSVSGFAPNATSDADFLCLVSDIKKGCGNVCELIEALDNTIKVRSTNYWVGLDTDTPEFYMGNTTCACRNCEGANYFHYYHCGQDANIDMKLSNFVVTAVSSTIKGVFSVRDKRSGLHDYDESFFRMNPECTNNASYGICAESAVLRGNVTLAAGNNCDVSGANGSLNVCGCLTVNGNTSLTNMSVSDSVTVNCTASISNVVSNCDATCCLRVCGGATVDNRVSFNCNGIYIGGITDCSSCVSCCGVVIGECAKQLTTAEKSISIGAMAQSVGCYSVSVGFGSCNCGAYSTAVGTMSEANGVNSVAIGNATHAKNGCDIVIGNGACTCNYAYSSGTACTCGAVAIGAFSKVFGQLTYVCDGCCRNYSAGVAIGLCANSYGESIAIGTNANAYNVIQTYTANIGNIAIGNCSVATAMVGAIAIGCCAKASDNSAIALGRCAIACCQLSIAIGRGAESLCRYSVAIGDLANSNICQGVSIGRNACTAQCGTACIVKDVRFGSYRTVGVEWKNTAYQCDVFNAFYCRLNFDYNSGGASTAYLPANGVFSCWPILTMKWDNEESPLNMDFRDSADNIRKTVYQGCSATMEYHGYVELTGYARD